MKNRISKFLSEPLVQFALIGLVLFVASRATEPEKVDPNLIVVDRTVHGELAELFRKDRNRLPTPLEMDELVDRYVMNEALYREARGLKLDHGDEMVRERLMQRIRLMMYSGVKVDNPPDDVLKAWFEENRDLFRRPTTLSVEIVGLDTTEDAARTAAAEMNRLEAQELSLKAHGFNVIRLNDRPRDQLVDLFNEGFIADIETTDAETWQAIPSPRGWQAARMTGREEGIEPTYEEARNAARPEWRQAQVQVQAREALEALMKRYPVERRPYSDDVVAEREEPTAQAPADTDAGDSVAQETVTQ